jgi:hypothetical protein
MRGCVPPDIVPQNRFPVMLCRGVPDRQLAAKSKRDLGSLSCGTSIVDGKDGTADFARIN